MANGGRFLLKVGQALEQEEKKSMVRRVELTPVQRDRIIQQETAGKFNLAEDFYRKQLVKHSVYEESTLPDPKYPAKNSVYVESTRLWARAPSQANSSVVKQECGVAATAAQSVPKIGGSEPGVLTEAHVFNRLGVQGCGEEVLAWIASEDEPQDEALGVKVEVTEEVLALVDAKDVEGIWRKVRLISVTLPLVVVEVSGPNPRQQLTVSENALRALTKSKEKTVVIHPSIQEAGVTLDAYDFDACEDSVAKSCAQHMLLWAHMSSHSSVEHVTVSRQSDEGKLPLILQVRALEPFKKGTLVLAPAYGEIVDSEEG